MKIRVDRNSRTADGVFGTLTLDWHPFTCFTVENAEKRIPVGTYMVEFTYSPHFNRVLPLVDVPGRDGIRIHPANSPCQLEGCIAVGDKREPDALDDSRVTFNQLNTILNMQAGISLEITESYNQGVTP